MLKKIKAGLIGAIAFIVAVGSILILVPKNANAFGVGLDNITGEPSKYRRHVLCNEAWRASLAYKEQHCKLRSVHWDSYKPGVKFKGYGEQAHMQSSLCWVHVECHDTDSYSGLFLEKGVHLGKIDYSKVSQLRRCRDNPSVVNATCAPLTQADITRMAHEWFAQFWTNYANSHNNNQNNNQQQ